MKKILTWLSAVLLLAVILLAGANAQAESVTDYGKSISPAKSISLTIKDTAGATHSLSGFGTDYTVVVLGRLACGNTMGTVQMAQEAKAKGYSVSIALLLIDNYDKTDADITAYVKNNKDVVVSKNFDYNASMYWQLIDNLGLESSGMLPVCVVLNKDGKAVYGLTGTDASGGTDLVLMWLMDRNAYNDRVNKPIYTVKAAVDYTASARVLKLVNQYRAQEGLPALKMDKEMLEAAMQRAVELEFYYAHYRPNDAPFYSISDRMNGENIAYGYSTPEEVMTAWMNSPGHRANILDEDYKGIGVGVVSYNGFYFWSQNFTMDTPVSVSKSGTATNWYTVEAMESYAACAFKSSSYTVNVGESIKLGTRVDTAEGVVFTNVNSASYTWKSSNTAIATVTSGGAVTGLKAGKVTITAVNKGRPSVRITATVTVKGEATPVTGVKLSKTTLSLDVGKTATLTATVLPSGATNKAVTWKSSNTAVATVSSTGKITAKKAGTVTITVTTQDGKKTASCKVTVKGRLGYGLVCATTKAFTSTTGKTVAFRLAEGTKVEIWQKSATWWKIKYNGTFGYIDHWYMYDLATKTPAASDRIGQGVSTREAAFYELPTASSKKLGTFKVGTLRNLYAQSGNWYQVYTGGKYVWVRVDGFDYTQSVARGRLGSTRMARDAVTYYGPGYDFVTSVSLKKDQPVNFYRIYGDWYLVYRSGHFLWLPLADLGRM